MIVRVLVRIIGLEPTRLAAPDPKSGMSTNFTISAQLIHCALIEKAVFIELVFVGAKINISSTLQRNFYKNIHSLFCTFEIIKKNQWIL